MLDGRAAAGAELEPLRAELCELCMLLRRAEASEATAVQAVVAQETELRAAAEGFDRHVAELTAQLRQAHERVEELEGGGAE